MGAVRRGKPAKPRSARALAPVEKIDIAIARTVAIDEETPAGRAIGQFAELGDQPPLRILCGTVIAAGVARGDGRLVRTGLRMVLAHSLATAVKAFIKDNVDRTRPERAMDKHSYRMKVGDSHAHGLQSMPSGHSAGVVAVAGAAMVDYPQVAVAATGAGGAILAAQLPSRNHFLSDIVAGSVIGAAALAIACAILPATEGEEPD